MGTTRMMRAYHSGVPGQALWHLCFDTTDPTPWYTAWQQGMMQGCEEAKQSFVVHLDRVPLEVGGPIILGHHRFFPLAALVKSNARIVIPEHNTYNPFFPYLTALDAAIYQHPGVEVIACTTIGMAHYIATQFAPRAACIPFGFPYRDEQLETEAARTLPWIERENLIVFPQRLTEDNNALLALRLAYELSRMGYAVIFSLAAYADRGLYPTDLWRQRGISLVVPTSREEYLHLLASAKYAISTTGHGSMCIALYEAARLGCRPLAPRGEWGLPPFTNSFDPTYSLLYLGEVCSWIGDEIEPTCTLDHFEPVSCVKRLQEALW